MNTASMNLNTVCEPPRSTEQVAEVYVTVQCKESNPQPQRSPMGTRRGAQQRLGQNEDVVQQVATYITMAGI